MKVALLAGGTGGAKLAHGFAQVLGPATCAVVVNVADDPSAGPAGQPGPGHHPLHPGRAGRSEPGWGVAGDTRTGMGMLERYGAETWFRIGDADLATHVHRAALMRAGRP